MTKKELREEFFKTHTIKGEDGLPRVNTHPHNLFEWFYDFIQLKCNCTVDETTGNTQVKCCNICGKPIEEFWKDKLKEL